MKRGAMLLEVMVAMAILLMASMTLGGIVMQSVTSMDRARKTMQACDLARSTLALIEAGLVDPMSASGPATRWDASMFLPSADMGGGQTVEDDLRSMEPPGPPVAGSPTLGGPEWTVEVETEPTELAGLYMVTVTAALVSGQTDATEASYTLRQVVRLGSEPEDVAGEEDELMDAARRGLQGGGSR
ncbi:MAG: type II secretion system protein [Leptolyngbya sp. PLA3]|nr:MAG: type II secretion system protein [Cyanobacteria bacterium CYA]MCE7968172.1 type II secretion system protein [Leptolyngbya sp. PL-A3]